MDKGVSPDGAGLSPTVQPASGLSGFATSIPDVAWVRTHASTPFLPDHQLIYALGRYGDVYGPIPFGLIHPAAWHGDMGSAPLDLIAFADAIAIEAGTAMTEGHGPQDESAGRETASPESGLAGLGKGDERG